MVGIVHPGYTYLCTMVGIVHPGYTLPGTMVGSVHPGIYTTLVPWWVVYTLGYIHPVHPWVYPHIPCTWHSTVSSGLGVTLRRREALGSKKEKPLGKEAFQRLKVLNVLGREDHSAQSYSALPVRN